MARSSNRERIYLVKLILKNGKTVKLVTGLRAPEEALFIEQQIFKV
jgi:hypothetical protein